MYYQVKKNTLESLKGVLHATHQLLYQRKQNTRLDMLVFCYETICINSSFFKINNF